MNRSAKSVVVVETVYEKTKIAGYKLNIFKPVKEFDFEVHTGYIKKEKLNTIMNDNRFCIINAYKRKNDICVKHLTKDVQGIRKIISEVRKLMETEYGTGTDLAGHCIEASQLITTILNRFVARIPNEVFKTVEGWCEYDDEYYGSDVPYDPHTWVESNTGYYIDVTADQFNPGMCNENEFKGIIFQTGLPHGMTYTEPVVYD